MDSVALFLQKKKLLSLAILTQFQSNIFLTILGCRDISQSPGWWVSRYSVPRQFSRGPFLPVLKEIETSVAQSIFWDIAGRKNKISVIPQVLGIAAEIKIRFLSWETWKDLGICFLLEGCIHLLKSFSQGRKSERKHISSAMVFLSCSSCLVSGVRRPAFEFWVHYTLGNCRHWT